jgi:hypothetical protein
MSCVQLICCHMYDVDRMRFLDQLSMMMRIFKVKVKGFSNLKP